MTTQSTTTNKRKLALILPAHNEEMVITYTIRSALAAGMDMHDIYVVSDGSKDKTVQLALQYLPWHNVFDQPQTGKAMAIKNGIDHFGIVDRYEWVHVADADGVFSSTYFTEIKNRLSNEYVAATGHVQSLKGGWISKYRTFEYTLGLEVMRRIQAFLGTIPVIPGATCVLRTDIIESLDFTQHSLTEDMDITLQIHRKNLGKIAYIPQAKAFTQDPKDIGDYHKQILRWYRGAWQVMSRHKIGLRLHKIDLYMGWMILEEVVLLLELTVFPVMCWWGQNYAPRAAMFVNDLVIFFAMTVWSAGVNKRADVVSGFPLFYFLRFVNLYAFCRAWFEIVVQKKFSSDAPGWSTAGRRYRITTEAVAN
jgi:cellulose synthase/poly-beta-1,6-N-acetylglucosamine synthase-like glycosyltransferase